MGASQTAKNPNCTQDRNRTRRFTQGSGFAELLLVVPLSLIQLPTSRCSVKTVPVNLFSRRHAGHAGYFTQVGQAALMEVSMRSRDLPESGGV